MHWMSVLLLSASVTAGASTNSLLEQGYRQMYNLQFAEAHHTFAEWKRTNPADPMGPVSDASAYLFSEFDRLHILQSEFFTHDQHFITDHKLTPDASVKQQFQKALHVAETHGWTRFVSMQDHLNLIYREEEREMLPLCREEKIGVTPYSPLASGRLTRDWSSEQTLRSETDQIAKGKYDCTPDNCLQGSSP